MNWSHFANRSPKKKKKGMKFKMALELELNQKNNQRIIEKASQYPERFMFYVDEEELFQGIRNGIERL